MLRRAPACLAPSRSAKISIARRARSRIHTVPQQSPANRQTNRNAALRLGRIALLTAGATTLWYCYANSRTVLNDAEPKFQKKQSDSSTKTTQVLFDDGHLTTIAWGSNREALVSPSMQDVDSFRTPSVVAWLQDVALRDLALHEKHGVCVDAKGDVYQWNARTTVPVASLTGKDIISVQAAPNRVFALSASGKVFVLSSEPSSKSENKASSSSSSSSWFSIFSTSSGPSQEYLELVTEQRLGRGEKFVSISAGIDHLLALTSHNRTFAHPMSKNANTYGQLGFRKISIPSSPSGSDSDSRVPLELIPKAVLDPYANKTRTQRIILDGLPNSLDPSLTHVESASSESSKDNIHFCDRLFEIPPLREIKIAQAVAGARTSFVRTGDGRVLAWGANEHGQLGLGSTVTVDTITVPTEVVFLKSAPARTSSQCVDINTGGDLTFFTVERKDGSLIPSTDLLACGMGQWGGLGTGVYTTAQGEPARVRAVSGLLEYCEETKSLQPIVPHALSVSPSGHVLLTLDTRARAGPGATADGARDVLSWGAGRSYQLGRGKRASSAVPAPLELPSVPKPEATAVPSEKVATGGKERFMLTRRRAREVFDLSGRRWGKNVEVEQVAVAGWESSMVYWRVCRN